LIRCAHLFKVGAIYGTASKADAGDAIGTAALAAIVRQTKIPVVAIGGIQSKNAGDCMAAGASGVAVISAILGTACPANEASAIARAVKIAQK